MNKPGAVMTTCSVNKAPHQQEVSRAAAAIMIRMLRGDGVKVRRVASGIYHINTGLGTFACCIVPRYRNPRCTR